MYERDWKTYPEEEYHMIFDCYSNINLIYFAQIASLFFLLSADYLQVLF